MEGTATTKGDLKSLLGQLNPLCRVGLEEAAGLCVSEGHRTVEIEHFLVKLIESPETDVQRVFRHYALDPYDATQQLTRALSRFSQHHIPAPTLSPLLVQVIEEAVSISSENLGSDIIRSGAILLALLDGREFRDVLTRSVPIVLQIPTDRLWHNIRAVVRGSLEDVPSDVDTHSRSEMPMTRVNLAPSSSTPALDKYTIDLTSRGRAGQIDPILGRDTEIRQIVDILMRRRQNNPILTGEAGVGKTAVVEGFALCVAQGRVPPALHHVSVRMLDLGLLQAGASLKGEFERRLKTVIAEVNAAEKSIILFIDEAHTLIGAGGVAGQSDAANLLKPALARGDLRTIAATTWGEYKKSIEKDPALARRFQVVMVDEPDEVTATEMVRGMVSNLEQHHKVRILDEAVREAVRLSHRHITERRLPDKAISVLDTACARVAVSMHAVSPEIDEARRSCESGKVELEMLTRERLSNGLHADRMTQLTEQVSSERLRMVALDERWKSERALTQKLLRLQWTLEQQGRGNTHIPEDASLVAELARTKKELATLQGDSPMVSICVDARVIASVIASWTGIPAGKMLVDEVHELLALNDRLQDAIVGQPDAIAMICERMVAYRTNLKDPEKPVGVFLLAGPSGVGKTETALALADLLYGGSRHLVTINMSEYQESHTVSKLKGSPPGYVGYGQGGVLTEAVRRNPYCVLLLDEIEKAHPQVLELFYQIFDKGRLEDSEGLTVDFKNTVILMTSAIGKDAIFNACHNASHSITADELVELITPDLSRHLPAHLMSRLVVIPYQPLGASEIQDIIRRKLTALQQRYRESHRAELTYAENVVTGIASRCAVAESGARQIDQLVTRLILPQVSQGVLQDMVEGHPNTNIHIALDPARRSIVPATSQAKSQPSFRHMTRTSLPLDAAASSPSGGTSQLSQVGNHLMAWMRQTGQLILSIVSLLWHGVLEAGKMIVRACLFGIRLCISGVRRLWYGIVKGQHYKKPLKVSPISSSERDSHLTNKRPRSGS